MSNPNKELWEKGDFTRIAATMRDSGDSFVESLGITDGMDVLDVGSGDARFWSYRGGKGTELDHGKAELSQEWGTLSITASGPSIVARWNDKPLVKGSDPHPIVGRVGLATMGPGAVSFDEFDFEAASTPSR